MINSIKVVRRLLISCVALACLATLARASVMEDTVATVNGQPILLSEYDNALNAALDQWRRSAPAFLDQKGAMAQLRERTLDQMIDDKLLEEDADKRKIKIHDREIDNGITEVKERNFRRDPSGKVLSDPEVETLFGRELKKQGLSLEQFRDRIRRQLMVRKLIDEVVRPKAKQPDDKDLHNTFEKLQVIVKGSTASIAGMPQDQAQAYLALGNRLKTLTAERVRVSHILIKLPPSASMVEKNRAMQKIRDIRKMIQNGGDFAELARKYSEDAESAPRGGDLDFILRGWMPKEFEKAAFSTPVGEVSQPIETQFGYHLIRVQEKKASESLDFDKIKDDLAQFLYNMNLQTELEKLVKSLREQARIETNLPKEKDSAKEKAN